MSSMDHIAELKQVIPEIEWQKLLHLIIEVVEKLDLDGIYDTNNSNDPVMASKFETFKQIYNSFPSRWDRKKSIVREEFFGLAGVVDEEEKETIRQLVVEHQKVFNQRWKTVEKCLKWVQKMTKNTNKKYVNALIFDGRFDDAVVEILFAGLSSMIEIENYFWKDDEEPALELIRNRFGTNCLMINVTSDCFNYSDYGEVSKQQAPHWGISSNESFKQLYRAQRDFLSK